MELIGKAKGKAKAIYNPHIPPIKRPSTSTIAPAPLLDGDDNATPSSSKLELLDPLLDPDSMAPSTLVLALRKQRREAKRAGRSEVRRSNLRASTLRTEEEILAKERQVKENPNKKGRKALHEGGEVRGVRAMTQDELIAAALEEEERNKESLRDWLRREEERRELRRVGRKRVKGPRWTWVSRTVGKVVEVVEREAVPQGVAGIPLLPPSAAERQTTTGQHPSDTSVPAPASQAGAPNGLAAGYPASASAPIAATSVPSAPITAPPVPLATSTDPLSAPELPYTRNYLILSQVPGGLPAEFSLILGEHTDWSSTKHVPARNRPLTRRPPTCPFTGLPAKYRHPRTGVQYATKEGYRLIEEMLANEYVWNETAGWLGREDEGCEDVEGWMEAVGGRWRGGEPVAPERPEGGDVEMEEQEVIVVEEAPKKKRGRKRKADVEAELA